jgi:very-short-patch-repair endonuclease
MSIARARALRQSANLPEQRAWAVLRQFRRYGLAVRRQHVIGRDIVDFAVLKRRLVIEIDGASHADAARQILDAARDARLAAAGWRVLRVPASRAISDDAFSGDILRELGFIATAGD